MISNNGLLTFALDLARAVTAEHRFERLIDAIRSAIHCDAIVILSRTGQVLTPLAARGLADDVKGRRFTIGGHPRFAQICAAQHPVIFPSDCDLPDPYDGMVLGHQEDLPVHACMGIPLLVNDELFGIVTLDGMTPGMFDHIDPQVLDVVASMCALSLNTAFLMSQLEQKSQHVENVLQELTEEALIRDGGELIGQSHPMLALQDMLKLVAPSDFGVLIEGETGVGKELVARTLHRLSQRSQSPMVYVNCAAIPESLIESELFGHVKGAFTGADRDRVGKFSLANGGTLFLDEIGELPLESQGSLLRAIQNQEIQAVGRDQVEKVDVRIIAATNRDLKEEVAHKRFRADLYHRLSVFPIVVPPLRQRGEDVLLLAGYFVEQFRRKLGLQQLVLSSEARQALLTYGWPGNVRELEHVISRAALLAKNARPQGITQIQMQHLGDIATQTVGQRDLEMKTVLNPYSSETETPAWSFSSLKAATEFHQRQWIEQALVMTGFNWSAAARQLDMDRANLVRLAKRLGLEVKKTLG